MAEDKALQPVSDNGRYSPAQTAAIKSAQITAVIDSQQKMLRRRTHGIDLYDFKEVQLAANEYMDTCKETAMYPSFMGLVAHMGLGRSWAYQFIRQHPEHETSMYLCRLRETWASGKLGLAQKGILSDASTIFELKNSALGFSDRYELETISAGTQDASLNRPPWAVGLSEEKYYEKLIEGIPDDE